MTDEDCALCGGELVEETVESGREDKIRSISPDIDEDEDLRAVVCQDCGHVAYRRS